MAKSLFVRPYTIINQYPDLYQQLYVPRFIVRG